jgi:cytochrome c oxidase assembly factor CtaG
MDMGSTGAVLGMLAMGLLTSVVAPLLVVAGRRRGADTPGRRPGLAVGILLGAAAVHGVLVLGPSGQGVVSAVVVHALLLAAGVALWLPVLGRGTTRLPPAGSSVYLFLACPLLDLAGVALVIRGDQAGGIAMIVGMFPIPLAAVVLTWRWIVREERAARVLEGAS